MWLEQHERGEEEERFWGHVMQGFVGYKEVLGFHPEGGGSLGGL